MEYFSYTDFGGSATNVGGVLGLSQNNQMLYGTEEIYVGDLFVDKLDKVGEIKSPEFSFALYGIG